MGDLLGGMAVTDRFYPPLFLAGATTRTSSMMSRAMPMGFTLAPTEVPAFGIGPMTCRIVSPIRMACLRASSLR